MIALPARARLRQFARRGLAVLMGATTTDVADRDTLWPYSVQYAYGGDVIDDFAALINAHFADLGHWSDLASVEVEDLPHFPREVHGSFGPIDWIAKLASVRHLGAEKYLATLDVERA